MSRLLPPATLAALRSVAAASHPNTAQIRRPPTDRTAANWDPATASATATVACAEIGAGQPTDVVVEGRTLTITPQRIALAYDADVQPRDYLFIEESGRVYEVIGESEVSAAHRAQWVILARLVT